jgi:16S rRNA (uracil1498-N3)-methyltransferase
VRRYWLEDQNVPKSTPIGQTILIEKDLFHHIFSVCRQQVGSKFELLNSSSQALFVEAKLVGKKNAVVEVLEIREIDPIPKPYIKLVLSIPKFNKLEEIIEKSVELGVHSVLPFTSEYSFVRDINSVTSEKYERWERIVKSATQQSGRGDLMKIDKLETLDQRLKSFNQLTQAVGLFPYEGASQQSLGSALKKEPRLGQVDEVWLFVGSEGGFSLKEVEKFQTVGLFPTTLGKQVLRVETACVTLVSVLKYELGLLS